MRRTKHSKKFLALFLFLLLELLYVLSANLFLRSGYIQSVVNAHPEKLYLDYGTAWTLLPGWVNFEGFYVEGRDKDFRWRVELPKGHVGIHLFALFQRRFETWFVKGQGGLFKIETSEAFEDKSPKSGRDPFSFRLQGLSLEGFNSLSIFGYHFQGEAFVGGSFDLWPGRSLSVAHADLRLSSGELRFGDRLLMTQLKGRVQSDLGEWLIATEKITEKMTERSQAFFDRLNAKIDLKGAMLEADFLKHYLRSLRWLSVASVTGDFWILANIEKGSFVDPCRASIVARRVSTTLSHYQAEGKGRIDWILEKNEENPSLHMKLLLEDYKGSNLSTKEEFASGKGLKLLAESRDLHLVKLFSDLSDLSASLEMGNLQISDLRFLNAFVPVAPHFEMEKGIAELTGNLKVSTRRSSEPGWIRLVAKDAKARFRKTRLSGDVELVARVHDLAEGAEVFDLSTTRVKLSGVRVLDAKHNKNSEAPWKGEVELAKGTFDVREGPSLEGSAQLNFDDARPVLALLANTSRVARLVERFAKMKELKGQSQFKIAKDLVEFRQLSFLSSDVDVRAQMRFVPQDNRVLALVKYGILELGISIDGAKTETKLIRSERWYESKLSGFE